MKNIPQYFAVSALLFFTGCHLTGNSQPSNPFAATVQTAPPPATFSAQGAYLGQTPSAYVPQAPAATFTPSTIPTAVPASGSSPFSPVNVPSNTPSNSAQPYSIPSTAGYGSINPSQGALLFQDNGQNSGQNVNPTPFAIPNTGTAVPTTAAPTTAAPATGWTAVLPAAEPVPAAAQSFPITAGYANQTASQGMENMSSQIVQPTGGNTTVSSYIAPNAVVASSAQITTIIEDDGKKNVPAPAAAEPKTMYANQY